MSEHTCHATGCDRAVPPKMFMCRPHWYRLTKAHRDAIWATYVPGQESRKDPTAAYLAAAQDAIRYLEEQAKLPPPPEPTLSELMKTVMGDCIGHQPHKQVGPCVYCGQCGRRLYQGTVMPPAELAALKEALATGGAS